MSAGEFQRTRYELDGGGIASIRVQPETALTVFTPGGVNGPPAGEATLPSSARVSGSNRRIGVKARSVTIRFTAGAPEGYEEGGTTRIPILTPGVYNAITLSSTVNYLGGAAVVVGKSPERVR